jgi:hypothetical protein
VLNGGAGTRNCHSLKCATPGSLTSDSFKPGSSKRRSFKGLYRLDSPIPKVHRKADQMVRTVQEYNRWCMRFGTRVACPGGSWLRDDLEKHCSATGTGVFLRKDGQSRVRGSSARDLIDCEGKTVAKLRIVPTARKKWERVFLAT